LLIKFMQSSSVLDKSENKQVYISPCMLKELSTWSVIKAMLPGILWL